MKIKDIVTEDVDMGWMAEIDAYSNPHHLEYIEKQVNRQNLINQKFTGTAVFTKPLRKNEISFSNIPPKDQPKSAGYVGNVDAQVRTDHITNARRDELIGLD